MITHEAAHGIASRLENIEIQSTGILMAFLLFGAFVEPDEDQLNRARLASKARVYGAGSLVNLLTAVLMIIILEIVRWDLLPMQIAYYLSNQLFWIGLLSLNVAIFNMLPLYPLDGDCFLITLVEALKKGSGSKVRAIMSTISLLVLAANLTLTFFRFGPYLL
jgi:Zn-dependent protease